MAKKLWKGNEAIAEAAIRAGCRFFFGYPITPQNEIPEYMAANLPKYGGSFVQSESEIAAINMVYGAAAAGARAMTSSSSPGISLKQEGISYMAAAQLPGVIVNSMRGGPALGSIQPSQGDYFQATRGGGNGDYRTPVLAPSNIQEATELMQDAFDIADKYRTPVMLLVDGMICQMMEPVEWRERTREYTPEKKTWAANGQRDGRDRNTVYCWMNNAEIGEQWNRALEEKYERIKANEIRWETKGNPDAEVLLVAYGTTARIAEAAMNKLEKEGISARLFRPVTLWPFPYEQLHREIAKDNIQYVVTAEMSKGQMIDDVLIAARGEKEVSFVGTAGGMIISVNEIVEAVKAAGREKWK